MVAKSIVSLASTNITTTSTEQYSKTYLILSFVPVFYQITKKVHIQEIFDR